MDTSVAVAVCLNTHEWHDAARTALEGRSAGLAGHAAFETFSVLTRLPPPFRRPPSVVARMLGSNFPHTRFLSADGAAELFRRLAEGEIAGGSVYDALVGETAREHGVTLVTCDRRALETYRVLGVTVEVLTLAR